MINKLFILVAALMLVCTPALAQEEDACDEAAQDALKLCLEQAEEACLTAAPASCEKPLLTIEEVRAASQEECGCLVEEVEEVLTCTECTAKNYGKYRSCVVKVLKGLRAANVISVDLKKEILKENKLCRATIKENKKKKKENKGKPEEE